MNEKLNRQEEETIKREVLADMKEFAYEQAPQPQEDWDLVWVISGPPMDISEDFKGDNEVLVGYDDKIAKKDAEKKINESKRRFETGIDVVKRVTALRLHKEVEEVTEDDIKFSGPKVYWNATDWANDNMRQRIQEGYLKKQGFPDENVIVSPNLGIEHTGHQFEKFPTDLLEQSRKTVIVSDIYHLPRIERYLDKEGTAMPKDKVVLYPAEPRQVPVGKALNEIKKVPKYKEKGIL